MDRKTWRRMQAEATVEAAEAAAEAACREVALLAHEVAWQAYLKGRAVAAVTARQLPRDTAAKDAARKERGHTGTRAGRTVDIGAARSEALGMACAHFAEAMCALFDRLEPRPDLMLVIITLARG
jgi:hypothetical protein